MLTTESVPIYRSADPDHLRAVSDALRRAGITWALLPSDQAIAAWAIEVSADAAKAARTVIERGSVR